MDTREEGQTSVRPSSNLLKPDERLAPVGYFNLARYDGYLVPVTRLVLGTRFEPGIRLAPDTKLVPTKS